MIHFDWAITKNILKSPSSPKIDLHDFTHLMFYIYIYISVNGPCTLTWSASLKPYTWYEHHKHIDNIYYYLYIIWIQIQLNSKSTHEKQDANWCIMKSHMLNCLFIFICVDWWIIKLRTILINLVLISPIFIVSRMIYSLHVENTIIERIHVSKLNS
jgi:hypothetical protein